MLSLAIAFYLGPGRLLMTRRTSCFKAKGSTRCGTMA